MPDPGLTRLTVTVTGPGPAVYRLGSLRPGTAGIMIYFRIQPLSRVTESLTDAAVRHGRSGRTVTVPA